MARYLLTLRETSGGMEHLTQFLLTEDDPQRVKYQFHRHVNHDYDVREDPQYKHRLVDYDHGYAVELEGIAELTDAEYAVMENYLPEWPTR